MPAAAGRCSEGSSSYFLLPHEWHRLRNASWVAGPFGHPARRVPRTRRSNAVWPAGSSCGAARRALNALGMAATRETIAVPVCRMSLPAQAFTQQTLVLPDVSLLTCHRPFRGLGRGLCKIDFPISTGTQRRIPVRMNTVLTTRVVSRRDMEPLGTEQYGRRHA